MSFNKMIQGTIVALIVSITAAAISAPNSIASKSKMQRSPAVVKVFK